MKTGHAVLIGGAVMLVAGVVLAVILPADKWASVQTFYLTVLLPAFLAVEGLVYKSQQADKAVVAAGGPAGAPVANPGGAK